MTLVGSYELPAEEDGEGAFPLARPRPAAGRTRKRIYARDHGVCHVCAIAIEFDLYEIGHIIDRCRGGSDRDSNLVTMCIVCNRRKPVHETRNSYLNWVAVIRAGRGLPLGGRP